MSPRYASKYQLRPGELPGKHEIAASFLDGLVLRQAQDEVECFQQVESHDALVVVRLRPG